MENAAEPCIYVLGRALIFPPVDRATPEGLVAVGGDLSVERLLLAYRSGLFPWYSEGDPILWFSPDPRMVLFPDELRISKSLRRTLAGARFRVSFDEAFAQVIGNCQMVPRPGQGGTWITEAMRHAYIALHELGYAHSVETWQGDELVGGLYGVRIGHCFFGESMFSYARDASKVAFVHMVEHVRSRGVQVIDCQVRTDHLASLGATTVSRRSFLELLADLCSINRAEIGVTG